MKEYEYSGKAMGTEFDIAIVTSDDTHVEHIATQAMREIEDAEKRFSRFQKDSELSTLNRTKKMEVSPELLEAILKAYELFEATKGVFNPLVQISRFGYDKSFPEMSGIANERGDYDIDFSSVIINKDASTVTLMPGQELDFGGFLKGFIAEKTCRNIMKNEGVTGAVVNLGGDIHARGTDAEGKSFIFDIFNPVTEQDDFSLPLSNESLATSGTYKRKWGKEGAIMHHILDATGMKNPDSDIVSASVVHEDGGKADAYAKVFLSLGPERALGMLGSDVTQYHLIRTS